MHGISELHKMYFGDNVYKWLKTNKICFYKLFFEL